MRMCVRVRVRVRVRVLSRARMAATRNSATRTLSWTPTASPCSAGLTSPRCSSRELRKGRTRAKMSATPRVEQNDLVHCMLGLMLGRLPLAFDWCHIDILDLASAQREREH
jgi:hypothetical protein